MFETVKNLYQYLQPVTVREGRLVIETDQNRERIIQGYLNQGHEFLTRETIEYYLNRYHRYDTEIKDGVILFDSLIQKYKDMDIFGLKQIIVESIKRRRQDAPISINKYITIMSEPSFSTKYGGIPKSRVYAIISKYIYEKNVNLTAMFRELNQQTLQWQ